MRRSGAAVGGAIRLSTVTHRRTLQHRRLPTPDRVSACGLPCSHLQERVSIPPRPLASRFDASCMARFSSQQMQRPMAQDRPILCAMALADATVVFPKAAVEHPMARIVHAPVCSHRLDETDGITGQRGQEQSLRDRDLTMHCAVGLDKANTGRGCFTGVDAIGETWPKTRTIAHTINTCETPSKRAYPEPQQASVGFQLGRGNDDITANGERQCTLSSIPRPWNSI